MDDNVSPKNINFDGPFWGYIFFKRLASKLVIKGTLMQI